MSQIKDVVILSAAVPRSAGSGGSLKSLNSAQLGTIAAKEAIAPRRRGCRYYPVQHCRQCDPQQPERFLPGPGDRRRCRSAGGKPCGHRQPAVRLRPRGHRQAAQQIQLGEVDTALAGGAESMSNSSYSLDSNRWGQRMGNSTITDDLTTTLLEPWDGHHMGITARMWPRNTASPGKSRTPFPQKATAAPPPPLKPGTSRKKSCR